MDDDDDNTSRSHSEIAVVNSYYITVIMTSHCHTVYDKTFKGEIFAVLHSITNLSHKLWPCQSAI